MAQVNLNVVVRKIVSGLIKSEDARTALEAKAAQRRDSAVAGIMATALTSMIECDLPKTDAGRKLYLAAWKHEWANNEKLQHLIHGRVISQSTWMGYRTGLFLAYCAGKDWHPNAHQTVDKGGIARPDWWEGEAKGNGKGAKSNGKGSKDKPTAKSEAPKGMTQLDALKSLREDAKRLAGRIATILGNDGNMVLKALREANLI